MADNYKIRLAHSTGPLQYEIVWGPERGNVVTKYCPCCNAVFRSEGTAALVANVMNLYNITP